MASIDWSALESLSLLKLGGALKDNPHPPTRSVRLSGISKHHKGYFQSPFSKAAQTIDGVFSFDDEGRFDASCAVGAMGAIADSLGLDVERHESERQSLLAWLETGVPLEAGRELLFTRLMDDLSTNELTEEELHNQPICRLVRKDQLVFDERENAVYQLSPAEHRLMPEASTTLDADRELVEFRRNQKIFWALSEVLLGAIAMFDSDLGRPLEPEELDKMAGTAQEAGVSAGAFDHAKEFIRIEDESDVAGDSNGNDEAAKSLGSKARITPHELNKFSPLRYWAPPAAFAHNVIHMLFWGPLYTGKDMYRRRFPFEEEGGQAVESVTEAAPSVVRLVNRAEYYYVAINRYNGAYFVITQYAKTFELLFHLAHAIYVAASRSAERLNQAAARGSEKIGALALALSELGDFTIPGNEDPIAFTSLLRADTFGLHTPIQTPVQSEVRLGMPFHENGSPELCWKYNDAAAESTVGELLKVIRDRMLELILWSKYQMEIRSVGTIPIHRLYRVEIDPDALPDIKAHSVEGWASTERDQRDSMTRGLFTSLKSGRLRKAVTLRKVFDRSSGGFTDSAEQLKLLKQKPPTS